MAVGIGPQAGIPRKNLTVGYVSEKVVGTAIPTATQIGSDSNADAISLRSWIAVD